MKCLCGTALELDACCAPIVAGARPAATAEALMRSRYTAYAQKNVAYLVSSHDPETRDVIDEQATQRWASGSEWLGLEILATERGGEGDSDGMVEFAARFRDERGIEHRHHERSKFVHRDGRWYFHDGDVQPQAPVTRSTPKVGRNDACPCGSGKKYKKCCGAASSRA